MIPPTHPVNEMGSFGRIGQPATIKGPKKEKTMDKINKIQQLQRIMEKEQLLEALNMANDYLAWISNGSVHEEYPESCWGKCDVYWNFIKSREKHFVV